MAKILKSHICKYTILYLYYHTEYINTDTHLLWYLG